MKANCNSDWGWGEGRVMEERKKESARGLEGWSHSPTKRPTTILTPNATQTVVE